ncbi:MAG: pilin [Clostridia bacterium]|nr:pilin [Clostridia bacterium]
MEKIMFKKVTILFLVAMLFLSCMSFYTVRAADWSGGVYEYIQENKDPDIGRDSTGAAKKIQEVLTILAVIFKIVAVATGIVILISLAIKYMMAAPGDRADIKKSMIPFVIGAFVLFAASGIVDILIKFSSQLSS